MDKCVLLCLAFCLLINTEGKNIFKVNVSSFFRFLADGNCG